MTLEQMPARRSTTTAATADRRAVDADRFVEAVLKSEPDGGRSVDTHDGRSEVMTDRRALSFTRRAVAQPLVSPPSRGGGWSPTRSAAGPPREAAGVVDAAVAAAATPGGWLRST
jgi:hypothetical protein